jgi:multiple sugar transport system permease protein
MRRSRFARLGLNLANLLVIGFFLLPIVTAAIGSLQSEKTLRADTRAVLPREWTLDNFRVFLSGGAQSAGSIYEQATYLPDNVKKIYYALGNSAVIAGSVTLLTLVFAALSAYAAVRLRLRWLAWLMELSVLARFVPIIVLMIPLYVTFRRLELLNSVWGVIIAETGFLLPYGILILAPYFAALPQELDEAARIDGCTRFTAFVRITLPLSTPALASFGAIVFIVSWNELLIPLILNNRAEFMTVPVVVASLVGDVHVFFNLMMALCLIAMAPSVILVLLLQKFVVQGLAAGAVKG